MNNEPDFTHTGQPIAAPTVEMEARFHAAIDAALTAALTGKPANVELCRWGGNLDGWWTKQRLAIIGTVTQVQSKNDVIAKQRPIVTRRTDKAGTTVAYIRFEPVKVTA